MIGRVVRLESPGVCAPDFYFASLGERVASGRLHYDWVLGEVFPDGGQGPPAAVAWVRSETFNPSSTMNECLAWNPAAPSEGARAIAVGPQPATTQSNRGSDPFPYDTLLVVWCIEHE